MKRKTFIKNTALGIAGGAMLPLTSCKNGSGEEEITSTQEKRTNWAGNYSYKAEILHEPTNVEEVQAPEISIEL